MSISGRILGKPHANGKPHIRAIVPPAALPGGEVRINGSHLRPAGLHRPHVSFTESSAHIVASADDYLIALVPDDAESGNVVVTAGDSASNSHILRVGALIAESLHPVTSPALDLQGNIYSTFSGPRGQKTPVSVYKVDLDYNVRPFVSDIMNATAIAFDHQGEMYVSSRFDGAVYRVSPEGVVTTYAEGMGVATGIAFDSAGSLYVGDRSGTVFKIDKKRETFVFATLEPSVSAYHLAFGPDRNLYVTGPTTSSYDAIFRIAPNGEISEFYRGLGRPQGMAFDIDGNLYVAASHAGKRGIVRITPAGEASLAVAGYNVVGISFAAGKAAVISTTSALFYLALGIEGLPLNG